MKNHVKEMLEMVKTCDEDEVEKHLRKVQENILKYGQHVEIFTLDDNYELKIEDITKRYMNLRGLDEAF